MSRARVGPGRTWSRWHRSLPAIRGLWASSLLSTSSECCKETRTHSTILRGSVGAIPLERGLELAACLGCLSSEDWKSEIGLSRKPNMWSCL